jgi:hypothetical protein
VAEDVCFPVAHRQVVLTIPKRLLQYMMRCPFSLSRLIKVTASGSGAAVELDLGDAQQAGLRD